MMTEQEIKKTWKNLLTPFIIGVIILIVSIAFNRLGSKRPSPQMFSLFGTVLGAVFIIAPGIKMFKFKKYLNSNKLL